MGTVAHVLTDNDELADILQQLRMHGQDRRYHHPRIGINGRMDTIQAAILLAKLDVFSHEVNARQRIGEKYTQALSANQRIIAPYIEPHNTSVFAQYTIQVNNREQLQKQLQAEGIPTAVHYPVPLHKQPALQTGEFDLTVAEALSDKVISLPMHPYLTDTDIDTIISKLNFN